MNALTSLLSEVCASPQNALLVVDNSATITFASDPAAALLGYSNSSLVGRDFQGLLHDSDARLFDTLPLSRANHEHVQLVHETGQLVSAGISLAAILNLGVDAYVLTIRPNETEADHGKQLRDELIVEQYCHNLNVDLIKIETSEQLTDRIQRVCMEVGELTNSHTVSLTFERPEREEMEPVGYWAHPDFLDVGRSPSLRRADGHKWRDAVLSRPFVVNDINQAPYDRPSALHMVPALSAFITVPLLTGKQRGVMVLTRRLGPHRWRDFDSRLAHAVGAILAAALYRSHIGQLWRLTFELGPIGFSIRTTEGRLVDCNQRYLDFYGLLPDQVEATDLIDRVHPDDRSRTSGTLLQIDDTDQIHTSHHLRVSLPDGRTRRLQITTILLPVPGQADALRFTTAHEVGSPGPVN